MARGSRRDAGRRASPGRLRTAPGRRRPGRASTSPAPHSHRLRHRRGHAGPAGEEGHQDEPEDPRPAADDPQPSGPDEGGADDHERELSSVAAAGCAQGARQDVRRCDEDADQTEPDEERESRHERLRTVDVTFPRAVRRPLPAETRPARLSPSGRWSRPGGGSRRGPPRTSACAPARMRAPRLSG